MKVTTLMENTACAERYAAEHGLSLFIETKKINILFDSGSSEAFADNAEKLGVDLGRAWIWERRISQSCLTGIMITAAGCCVF